MTASPRIPHRLLALLGCSAAPATAGCGAYE
jgi:hypothetical protein